MEVQVISIETIKPSSPTPSHLRSFTISIVDKITPLGYVPFISFYKFPMNDQHLKESLSETLALFYPLAGIIKEDLTVDCNDSGSLFTTTRVNCSLASFLGEPRPRIDLLYKLTPQLPQLWPQPKEGANQIVIQLNKFDCGGVAICVCFLHKMIDAITISEFLRCWGCICSGKKKELRPDFSAAQLFPHDQKEELPKAGLEMVFEKSCQREGNGITKRFVFEAEAISALQEKARTQYVPNPSRVEVVSAFIWKHCMSASTLVHGSQHPSLLTQAIDLRRRMIPPLPKSSVGNILWTGISYYKGKKERQSDDFGILVGLVRESIKKIRDEFVPKLKTGKGYEAICEYLEDLKEICGCEDLNPYMLTSWCKIGFNEVDFGWGKPIWVSQIGGSDVDLPFKNLIGLMDGGDDSTNKIEAWVVLAHREMLELELDLEFLAFATPNPPIFI